MFILSSISSNLEFSSPNHTWLCETSELKVFKNINILGEMSNNWPNNLFGTNSRFKTHIDDHFRQYYNGIIVLQ